MIQFLHETVHLPVLFICPGGLPAHAALADRNPARARSAHANCNALAGANTLYFRVLQGP